MHDRGGAVQQEEWSSRFETDFDETAAEASTAAADHGKAPLPTLSLQDIDAAIDKEMASPQVDLFGQCKSCDAIDICHYMCTIT